MVVGASANKVRGGRACPGEVGGKRRDRQWSRVGGAGEGRGWPGKMNMDHACVSRDREGTCALLSIYG